MSFEIEDWIRRAEAVLDRHGIHARAACMGIETESALAGCGWRLVGPIVCPSIVWGVTLHDWVEIRTWGLSPGHPDREPAVRRVSLEDLKSITVRPFPAGLRVRVQIGQEVFRGTFLLMQSYLVPEVLLQAACVHLDVHGSTLKGRQAAIRWLAAHGAGALVPEDMPGARRRGKLTVIRP